MQYQQYRQSVMHSRMYVHTCNRPKIPQSNNFHSLMILKLLEIPWQGFALTCQVYCLLCI